MHLTLTELNRTRSDIANTKASRSAEGVAGIRAIETLKPEADRLVSDPYAKALVPGGIMFSISIRPA